MNFKPIEKVDQKWQMYIGIALGGVCLILIRTQMLLIPCEIIIVVIINNYYYFLLLLVLRKVKKVIDFTLQL